jgi:hypothetical protein
VAGPFYISFQNLLDTINVAVTAATAVDVFDAVKVNSVEMWAAGSAAAPVTVSMMYGSPMIASSALQVEGDERLHSDTSMSIEPAHLKARPSPKSLCAFYQRSLQETAFSLSVIPAGTIVDVSLSFRQPILGHVVATQSAPAAANPGQIYYRGLDGAALAATQLIPLGVTSID